MNITIIQEDIDKAREEIKIKNICKCCIIFQALKRNNIIFNEVNWNFITDNDYKGIGMLDERGTRITRLIPKEWDKVHPGDIFTYIPYDNP